VAAATVLEAVHRLAGAAWATTVLGLAVLAVASWCLPVIRTLKIGGAEFTKEIGYREETQVVRLSLAPLTVGAPPYDSLRQSPRNRPSLRPVLGGRPVGDEVAEETFPASDDGAAGPAEIIAGELRQVAERDRTAPDEADNVYRALRRASVYALGEPAGDVEGDHGTESDLLHFAVDDKVSGGEIVMLPVFTGLEPMQAALLRNPDWQTLSVLEVNGAAVADNVDPEVHIVVDPWTEGEHQFPSRAETHQAGETGSAGSPAPHPAEGSPSSAPP
jgi:SseB protein N-terminal domain